MPSWALREQGSVPAEPSTSGAALVTGLFLGGACVLTPTVEMGSQVLCVGLCGPEGCSHGLVYT